MKRYKKQKWKLIKKNDKINNIMKLHFYGAARSVTGANYLLEIGDKKILVDCGMFQGSLFADEKNYEPFPYNPKKIDYLFITHAHIDPIGRIPKSIKK